MQGCRYEMSQAVIVISWQWPVMFEYFVSFIIINSFETSKSEE